MRLHNARLEDSLKEKYSGILRAEPNLRRSKTKGPVSRLLGGETELPILRLAFPCFLVLVMNGAGHHRVTPEMAMTIFTIWLTASISFQCETIRSYLYRSKDMPSLVFLPISDQSIFGWQWHRYCLHSRWLILDLFVGYGFLAYLLKLDWLYWLIIPFFALAQWFLVVAISMAINAFRPLVVLSWVGVLAVLVLVGLVLRPFEVAPMLYDWLGDHGGILNFVLPVGWFSLIFFETVTDGNLMAWLLMIPVVGLFSLAPKALGRLRSSYRFQEQSLDLEAVPLDRAPTFPAVASGGGAKSISPSGIADDVRKRQFLTEWDWRSLGPIERWVSYLLTPRERRLVECLHPGQPNWSSLWRKGGLLLILLVILWGWTALNPGRGNNQVFDFGTTVLGLTAFLVLFPSGAGLSRANQTVRSDGSFVAFHAGLPVEFLELGRLNFKVAFIRSVALLPFAVLYGVLHVGSDSSIDDGFTFGLKVTLFCLAVQPYLVAVWFSSTTRDTSGFNLNSLVTLLGFLVCGFIVLGFGLSAVFVAREGTGWLLVPVWVSGYLFYRYYGWQYSRRAFDLIQHRARGRRSK